MGTWYAATQRDTSAFAIETGEEVWHYRNDNLLFGSPAVAEGVVVIADEAGVVTAIDARTGRESGKACGRRGVHDPCDCGWRCVRGDKCTFTTAFELKTGAQLWRRDVGGESSTGCGR